MKLEPIIHELTLAELREQLESCWSTATSAGGYTPERPSTGQCAVTAMVVQDLFGGDLLRYVAAGESHYCNRLPDGTEVDLTRDQFPVWTHSDPPAVRERSYLESSEATMSRYRLLVQRLNNRITRLAAVPAANA